MVPFDHINSTLGYEFFSVKLGFVIVYLCVTKIRH